MNVHAELAPTACKAPSAEVQGPTRRNRRV